MKKLFMASLCKNGVLGGGLLASDDSLTFMTGKVTVPAEYRSLKMPYADIIAVERGFLTVFPTLTLTLKNGKSHKFVVFAPKRLLALLAAKGVQV